MKRPFDALSEIHCACKMLPCLVTYQALPFMSPHVQLNFSTFAVCLGLLSPFLLLFLNNYPAFLVPATLVACKKKKKAKKTSVKTTTEEAPGRPKKWLIGFILIGVV